MKASCLFVMFLLLVVVEPTASGAQSSRQGTWSARSSAGAIFRGTWTAVPDPKTGAATGTWTLDDEKGKPLRRGAWSAAKSAKEWNGAWRATVSGRKAEYSGTWTASVDLDPNARFAELFELAVKAVVSGSWHAGGQSGTWSIRAFER